MSIHYLHRHILEDLVTGFSADPGANHVSVVRRPTIVSVLAHAGGEPAVAEALKGMEGCEPRFCSPSEWLLVSRTLGAENIADVLAGTAGAAVIDQSDGKVL